MEQATTPAYGDQVDPADVSYEPPRSSADVGHYYLVAHPETRVVWVRPADGLTAPFFAIYTGAPSEYEPNVEASA